MKKTHALLYLFLAGFCLFSGRAGLRAQSMEVRLDEVTITAARRITGTTGLHTYRIDTLLKTRYMGTDLARILSRETNLNITSYGGEGSLSSVRLRGTGPSQTQVNWNGIPVNGATTGSTDLSLLTGGFSDAIDIAYGASGSLFGSGTFGGSINMINSPDWDNRIAVNAGAEAGSWGHVKTGLSVRTGNETWQYHLSGLFQSSPNTYSYNNEFKPGNPLETRINDSMMLGSVQHHLFLRLPKNWFVQYGGWWYSRSKLLPAPMSSEPVSSSSQSDLGIRNFARIAKWFNRSSIELTAALFSDSLVYRENKPHTDSLLRESGIGSSSLFLGASHRWFVNRSFTLESGAEGECLTARTESYGTTAREWHGAIWGLAKYTGKRLESTVSYRQAFYSMTGPHPLFSAAIRYRLPVTGITVKGQLSNKFRYPTLNDRFWLPGGNPGLLPEQGMGYDLGADWQPVRNNRVSLAMSAQIFYQNITNWIQWVPAGSWWTPQNIRSVTCDGLELDLGGSVTFNRVLLKAKAMYSFTESLNRGLVNAARQQKQLSYVPFHILNCQASVEFMGATVNMGYRYTGRRFTTDDHDPWLALDPVHVVDLSADYALPLKNNRLMLGATIGNLFNNRYQLIRAFPAPGRSFRLSVNYLLNSKVSAK